MQGRINKVFDDRHYGWLRDINNEDWFFHFDDILDLPVVEKGVVVSFDKGIHQGKTKAVNIRRLTAQQLLGGEQ